MSKFLTSAALAAGLIALSGGAASAYDRDGYNDGYPTNRHIRQDWRQTRHDANEVREERNELAQAHRRLRWAWWRGDYWAAKRAERDVREERRELYDAQRKLHRDREDLYEDRRERRHWWW